MSLTFGGAGNARPLLPSDISDAARLIGVEPQVIRAVIAVETGGAGGFLRDGSGRLRILFESLHFHNATHGKWDAEHPTVSTPDWQPRLYRAGAAEYDRLNEAVALDQDAALSSASWGLFQILGSNHAACEYPSALAMVRGMEESEGAQLTAFCHFLTNERLVPYLVAHDWAAFARRYNGPSYAQNRYDEKLAQEYGRALGDNSPMDTYPASSGIRGGVVNKPLLHIGCSGPDVKALQAALNAKGARIAEDGLFGHVTQVALIAFQSAAGLVPDGLVGPATDHALGLGT